MSILPEFNNVGKKRAKPSSQKVVRDKVGGPKGGIGDVITGQKAIS
jgi:hypothetical protein